MTDGGRPGLAPAHPVGAARGRGLGAAAGRHRRVRPVRGLARRWAAEPVGAQRFRRGRSASTRRPRWSPGWSTRGYLVGARRRGARAVGRLPRRAAAAGRRSASPARWPCWPCWSPRWAPADHVSYAAYGRIAAGGGDPYVVPPQSWAGGHDPVTSAVEPPWTTTPSIYGPVATAVQALCSLVGGDSLRLTVWCWQLVCLAAWLLRRLAGDPAVPQRLCRTTTWRVHAGRAGSGCSTRCCSAVLLVGAHVDLLGAAFAVGLRWPWPVVRPLLAGMLLGAAVGVKVTFAAGRAGGAVRLVAQGPWRVLAAGAARRAGLRDRAGAGPAVGRARTSSTSSAGPAASSRSPRPGGRSWSGRTGPFSNDAVRDAVVRADAGRGARRWPCCSGCWCGPVPAGGRRPTRPLRSASTPPAVAVVLGAAYVLGAPYSLPWYDAVAWAPLALVAVPALDALLLVRLMAYCVAYVPGRVIGSSQRVQDLTLGYRRELGSVDRAGSAGWSAGARRFGPGARRPPAPARSPR